MGAEALIVFFIAGFIFVFGAVVFSKIISPKSDNKAKWEPYECGVETQGEAWIQFKVGYYLFALLFLLFDVEMIFLIPWSVVMKDVGLVGFIEAVLFLFILGLGLLYAWKKGALKWE